MQAVNNISGKIVVNRDQLESSAKRHVEIASFRPAIMQVMNVIATDEQTDEGLLTKKELATRLRVSPRTVDQHMRSGRLCFLKIGRTVRFRWVDVVQKLNAYRVN